jgi:hypothetical protein
MPGLSDTAPDVDRLLTAGYRRMPPARRWRNLDHDYRLARSLHAAGVRARRPGATPADIQADWIAQTLGRDCPAPIPERLMPPSDQDFQPVLRHAIDVFDGLGIGYAVGGSLASSLHGIGRMTRDADLTADPFPDRVADFLAAFPRPDYYLSPDAVRDALRARATFNLVHLPTGYKIDVFVRTDDPFERAAFDRRGPYPMPDLPGGPVMVHSPEDTVLFKLRWYRLGGGVSDRQWHDVLGVLKVQAGRLDDAYLDRWATELGVADLLARVRAEAGPAEFRPPAESDT